MDGNRRWATENGLPKVMGYTEGAENIKKIINTSLELGVDTLTFWALSTDNLEKRPKNELKHLFLLIEKLPKYLKESIDNGVKVRVIGNLSKLPESTQDVLEKLVEETGSNDKMTVVLAINYGGHDELKRAFAKAQSDGKLIDSLSSVEIDGYLDTAGLLPVDLLIRTGGDSRTSGFLPWQTDYAELYFSDVKWPAFGGDYLKEAVEWFSSQRRNWGK